MPSLAIVQETTSQVLSDQALAEHREKLDLALNASGMVGTWDWDIAENRVTADERFAALFGISLGEAAVGLPIEIFFKAMHTDDRTRVWAEIDAALKDAGPVRFEYRVVDADGGIRWVVASGRVITDRGWPRRPPARCRRRHHHRARDRGAAG